MGLGIESRSEKWSLVTGSEFCIDMSPKSHSGLSEHSIVLLKPGVPVLSLWMSLRGSAHQPKHTISLEGVSVKQLTVNTVMRVAEDRIMEK